MEKVISNVIMMVEHLRVRVSDLEFITQSYHEWKKDKGKFTKYLHKKVEKLRKDRASDSIPDDRRQEISKSVQSNNS